MRLLAWGGASGTDVRPDCIHFVVYLWDDIIFEAMHCGREKKDAGLREPLFLRWPRRLEPT